MAAEKKTQSEIDWQKKIDNEARRQRTLKQQMRALANRPHWRRVKPVAPGKSARPSETAKAAQQAQPDIPEAPEITEEPEATQAPEKKVRLRRLKAKPGLGPAAARVVPCAALLLLAPFITGPARLYLPVLLITGAPLAYAALKLRPKAWLFSLLAPLLPIEAWFALRCALWDPAGALVPALLCALAGTLYYFLTKRGKKLGGRAALLFITVLAAASLLVPAARGLALELRISSPSPVTDFDKLSKHDDAAMARRMLSAYEHLQQEQWESKERADKLAALQAMLDMETDTLGIARFDLQDPMVYTAASGAGHTSVPGALLSGGDKAEMRVRSMCHLAYHLMQLSVTQNANLGRLEASAGGYENMRYKAYAAMWENREVKNDHVQ